MIYKQFTTRSQSYFVLLPLPHTREDIPVVTRYISIPYHTVYHMVHTIYRYLLLQVQYYTVTLFTIPQQLPPLNITNDEVALEDEAPNDW